jgi:hypothetical protein
MFIFCSLLESTPEISQSAVDVQEPDFGLNGTRLPKTEWKSISIRNIHSVGVGRVGLVWQDKNADWLAMLLKKQRFSKIRVGRIPPYPP